MGKLQHHPTDPSHPVDGNLATLKQLQSSCIAGKPLIQLGKGEPSELNYNLPQSSCFDAKGYLTIAVPDEYWLKEARSKPKNNFFDAVAEYSDTEIRNMVTGAVISQPGDPFTALAAENQRSYDGANGDGAHLRGGKDDIKDDSGAGSGKDEIKNLLGGSGKDPIKNPAGGTVTVEEIENQIAIGHQPQVSTNLFGETTISFQPRPLKPDPRLVMCFHFKVCSYLGDYGAGKTVKTFSLLPGEKTEISIKTYKHRESVRHKAENVLDSFSESSTQELEKIVEHQIKDSWSKDSSSSANSQLSSQQTKNWEAGGGLKLTVPLLDIGLNIGGGGGGTNTTNATTNNSATVNSSIQTMTDTLNTSLDRHVANSTALREVEINTEVTETEKEGEEISTTRQLENINFSRVLNFVFRQLQQEYLTVTYLHRVNFVYANGYAETKRVVELDGLPGLLKDLLNDDTREREVLGAIMAQLCHLSDYQGAKHSFVEHVSESAQDCCAGSSHDFAREYCRKRSDLSMEYAGKTVPGIIVDVKRRILRTDSVITEALLGQGEALDCYNMQLQDAAAQKAQLENRALELENARKLQAMEIINLLDDPVQKAELYKRVFGDCCDVPQTQIIN